MTTTTDWQTRVGEVWAAEWCRTDRSFADLAPRLDAAILAAAPAGPGVALDIGCGAGATTAALAAARPDLAITGIDLSAALIDIAGERVPSASFRVADAAVDPLDIMPDLFLSRHGVMFFADPVAAFARLREQAAPGAALVFSCFRDRRYNPWAGDLVAIVTGERPAATDGYTPGPFGFADPALVERLLTDAGWTTIGAEVADFAYRPGEGDDPVADAAAFFARIGPIASALAAMPEPDRSRAHARLLDALSIHSDGSRVQFPASAWLWRAQAGKRS
ncbi:class I SAM-dependent methyltransferase [Sphingomonas mollis]|uniref:Methyltransferase domain-containing protein n=1 Tax=Sphingomonas mollis TaxID=2795726 RepID=A0ABS0XMZ6_9SPHN|nr:methyltransferase domain-containing protein [Sphingomonas sp. BT553]MBJ6121200.1 methyltransferase domain-containing protein [Sphingomonas sp. BT553]